MRLFIAEKPSVAKAIAAELGQTGKGRGYIECGSDIVTWFFGHMLEQADPDTYTAADAPRAENGKKSGVSKTCQLSRKNGNTTRATTPRSNWTLLPSSTRKPIKLFMPATRTGKGNCLSISR